MFFNNLQALKSSIQSIGSSLEEIDKSAKQWVMQPVNDDQNNDDFDINSINISQFSNVFATFEDSINIKEFTESYNNLASLRNQVSESKKRLDHLIDNKASVGPQEVLNEAINLKMLIPKLRSAETDFVYKFMNNWKESLSKLCDELQKIATN